MKTLILPLLAAVLALPVGAQERFSAGVTYDRRTMRTIEYGASPYRIELQSAANSAAGVTFDWHAWRQDSMTLSFGLGYRFKGASDLEHREDAGGATDSGVIGTYSQEHLALGAQMAWRRTLDFGLGLQVRQKKLAMESRDPEDGTWRSNYTRPWIQGMVGYTFPGDAVKPYAALTVALPLTSAGKPDIGAVADDHPGMRSQLVRALASKFEVGIQVGIRF